MHMHYPEGVFTYHDVPYVEFYKRTAAVDRPYQCAFPSIVTDSVEAGPGVGRRGTGCRHRLRDPVQVPPPAGRSRASMRHAGFEKV